MIGRLVANTLLILGAFLLSWGILGLVVIVVVKAVAL